MHMDAIVLWLVNNSLLTIPSLPKVNGYPVTRSDNFEGLAWMQKVGKLSKVRCLQELANWKIENYVSILGWKGLLVIGSGTPVQSKQLYKKSTVAVF